MKHPCKVRIYVGNIEPALHLTTDVVFNCKSSYWVMHQLTNADTTLSDREFRLHLFDWILHFQVVCLKSTISGRRA